mgnify:CR=1 FL=1
MPLQVRAALIRDSEQGIGRSIALRLAKDGADIIIVDLNKTKIQKARYGKYKPQPKNSSLVSKKVKSLMPLLLRDIMGLLY